MTITNTNNAIAVDNAPLPILDSQAAESIVFRRDNTKGVFHKRVVSRDIITNHRIIHTADCNNYSPQIMLEDLDDVLTMNSSPNGNYQYFGTSIASRYHIRSGIMMRYGYGNVSTRHRTSADILFIKDGKPQIIFSNVRNAQDVVKMVKSMRKLRIQQHHHQQQQQQ
jgi:hypothetical protein